MTISAMVSSATLRVLENGALNTGMPMRRGGVEVHLVGADREAADGDQRRMPSSAAALSRVRERMPTHAVPL